VLDTAADDPFGRRPLEGDSFPLPERSLVLFEEQGTAGA